MAKEKIEGTRLYKNLIMTICTVFILLSIAMISGGIWFFIERNYMSSVMQSDLFSAASILIFVVGIFVFVVSFMGFCGAYSRNRCLLLTFFVIVLFLLLLALCAAFVAAAFQGEIASILKSNMDDTLIKRYRNNTHNITINRIVTEGWDRMQIRLNCCAVDNEGWGLYQNSSWYLYRRHNNFELSEIDLVPESCCRRATYDWDKILNQWICQKTQGGPPMTKVGSPNGFLNYQGCYEAAKVALGEVIWVIFGFGIIVAILNIIAMVCAVLYSIKIKKHRDRRAQEIASRKPRGEYQY